MPAPSALHLATHRRNGHTVVSAVGTIDQATVIQLRTLLLQALGRPEGSLLLDLTGVDHIDEAGLDAIRRTAARARLVGGQLRLVAPSRAIAQRLRGSDLHRHVPVDDALSGALATSPAAPGVEDPPADWLEQRQPVDPTDIDEPIGLPASRGDLPADADPADLVDQHTPVPLDEEDYPSGN